MSLETLERPVLLQVRDDVHALQPHLPWTLLENRLPIRVCVPKGPPQCLCRLCFTPEP